MLLIAKYFTKTFIGKYFTKNVLENILQKRLLEVLRVWLIEVQFCVVSVANEVLLKKPDHELFIQLVQSE